MRLIDADVLKSEWKELTELHQKYTVEDFIDSLNGQPSVDAQPIIHAHWKRADDVYSCYCSNCGKTIYDGNISKFCPNCGARMKEVKDE